MKVSFASLFSQTAVVGLLAASAPAFAQSAPDNESDVVAEKNAGVGDIIVTARRTSENLQSVPVAVTVPTGATLDKAQIVSFADLARIVPGIVIAPSTGQPASSFIGIRGQAASDALMAVDQAVGQYFDGVYIARSSGALFNFVDVDRVEVLRGAQGTLFGRNTTGGAVSIISKKPSGEFGGSVRLRYGNYDQLEATGVLNLPIAGDQVAARLVYQHIENGSYGTNQTTGNGLGSDNVDFVRGTLRIAPGDGKLTVNVQGDFSKRSGQGQLVGLKIATPNAGATALFAACTGPTANALCPVKLPAGTTYANYAADDPATGFRKNNFYDPFLTLDPTGEAESWGVSATTEYEINDATKLKAITAWRGVTTASLSDNDGTPFAASGGRLAGDGNFIDQAQFSQEVQLSTSAVDGRLDMIVGGFYFNERGNDTSRTYTNFPTGARRRSVIDGDVQNKSYAGFGQLNFKITPELRFTGGTRYTRDERSILRRNIQNPTDAVTGLVDPAAAPVCLLTVTAGSPCAIFNERNFGYWSYTAGFDYRPNDMIFVYVKTNKASRAGGFNARATLGTPVNFNPETVKDYEIGLKLDLLDRRLRVNSALFQTDYSGIQRTVPTIVGGVISNTIVNAASARIRGLEAEVTVSPTNELLLGVSATFLDPVFKNFSIPVSTATPGVFTQQDVSETPYSFAAKKSFSVFADYTVPLGADELNLRADYAFRGDSFTSGPLIGPGFNQAFKDTARIKSYGILNAQISYKFADPSLEVALYARNLTGTKYETRLIVQSNTAGTTSYTPGEPRMYGVRLTVKFGGEN